MAEFPMATRTAGQRGSTAPIFGQEQIRRWANILRTNLRQGNLRGYVAYRPDALAFLIVCADERNPTRDFTELEACAAADALRSYGCVAKAENNGAGGWAVWVPADNMYQRDREIATAEGDPEDAYPEMPRAQAYVDGVHDDLRAALFDSAGEELEDRLEAAELDRLQQSLRKVPCMTDELALIILRTYKGDWTAHGRLPEIDEAVLQKLATAYHPR